MAVHSAEPVGATANYAHTERAVFGSLMIGAPLLMLGAAALHPPHGIESGSMYYHAAHDHSTRFYVSHTLFFFAAVLFVPTIVAFARMVHSTHPKAAFWGFVLSMMGFVGWGALDGIDYMAWVAGKSSSGLDEAAGVKYIDAALNSAGVLVPVLLVFTLLPVGLIVLAIALVRAKVLPAWIAWLMPIGIIGIAGSLQYTVLLVLSALALLVSFGYVGVKLLEDSDSQLSVAAPV